MITRSSSRPPRWPSSWPTRRRRPARSTTARPARGRTSRADAPPARPAPSAAASITATRPIRHHAHALSEAFLGRLKRLVDDLELPWNYAPLHHHLRQAEAEGRFPPPEGDLPGRGGAPGRPGSDVPHLEETPIDPPEGWLLTVAQRRSNFPAARIAGCFPTAPPEKIGANGGGFGPCN